uniref:Uncharacterized protein n=1 Tax=Romanomermis culicivorax TaxID=13658 RepID=A0A915JGD2_ROMCU
MPKISHTPPDFTRLPSQSSSPNTATAMGRALSFDQMLLPRLTNIAQSSVVPTPLKQPPQPPRRMEQLLEQLIQRYDCDYKEQKSCQCPKEILPNNWQQSPPHQSQT